MNKKNLFMAMTFAVVLIVYNVVVFLLKQSFNPQFWVSYGFITFSFVFVIVSSFIMSNKDRPSMVTGLPMRSLAYLYFIVEFIMGTVFMLVPEIEFVWFFIPQFLVLSLFILVFIPSLFLVLKENKREIVKTQNENPDANDDNE